MSGRQFLTKRERAEMALAQDGRCAWCRGKARDFHADHSTPNAFRAGKPDQLLCTDCHKVKTFGTKATSYGSDIHAIAKVRRLKGETKQNKRPFPKGRGFRKDIRRKISGEVERRE